MARDDITIGAKSLEAGFSQVIGGKNLRIDGAKVLEDVFHEVSEAELGAIIQGTTRYRLAALDLYELRDFRRRLLYEANPAATHTIYAARQCYIAATVWITTI